MGVFKETLFGKIDLDTLTAALVMGVVPGQGCRFVSGSASAKELKDKNILCLEVGGTGRTDENNFDHHPEKGEAKIDLSAAAQALERLARLVRYVDEVDRGIRIDTGEVKFPSLVALVSGMKLCAKDPAQELENGLRLLRAVVQSGLDPYGCMEKIVDWMPEAAEWIKVKRDHEERFTKATKSAIWFRTITGIKVAAVETDWVGAPGALYGQGAHVVVVLNPKHEQGGKVYRKYTVAVHRDLGIDLSQALQELLALEKGWGGPTHMTIIGSPVGEDSQLSMQTVANAVTNSLQKTKLAVKKDIKKNTRKEKKRIAA